MYRTYMSYVIGVYYAQLGVVFIILFKTKIHVLSYPLNQFDICVGYYVYVL